MKILILIFLLMLVGCDPIHRRSMVIVAEEKSNSSVADTIAISQVNPSKAVKLLKSTLDSLGFKPNKNNTDSLKVDYRKKFNGKVFYVFFDKSEIDTTAYNLTFEEWYSIGEFSDSASIFIELLINDVKESESE